MGICERPRLAIFHKNVASMISKFTTVLGDSGYNITDMTNKSKGDHAYTLIDLETNIDDAIVKKMKKIEGVVRVRVVRKNV